MNYAPMIIGMLLMAGILVLPASAFTINNLGVNIAENGDAEISIDYSLTWVERGVVFMRIAHPDQQLERVIESYSRKEVTVSGVSPAGTDLFVEKFVQVDDDPEGIVYTTPSMDFSIAEQQAKGYWFSRFVTVDATPDVTVITFPDGYQEKFYNVANIPSITHQTGN
jgi:hypothetical protein